MANLETSTSKDYDLAFRALGDATRRAIIAELSSGEASVSELAKPFDMALPTFLKHLNVLETSGLITTRKTGRVRTCRLQTARLKMLTGWIAQYEQDWEDRLGRLAEFMQRKEDQAK